MSDPLIGVTLDCSNLDTVLTFWQQALNFVKRRRPTETATFRTLFAPPGRGGLHHLTIQQVPESKAVKNRAHLDLFVEDADADVERLTAIGASLLRDEALADDVFRTIVMADPEGNEFCIVEKPPT